MQFEYPASAHCDFADFPVGLEVRLGARAGEAVAGASLGTRLGLAQTPHSGFVQGVLSPGSPLPDLAMVYSDTGSDSDFSLKLSFDGFTSFYRETALDTTLRFNACKRIVRHDAEGNEDPFVSAVDCVTGIAASESDPVAFAEAGSVREFIFSNQFDPMPQYIYFSGQWYLFVHQSVIKIVSASGELLTLQYISMPIWSVRHPYFVVTHG